MLTDYGTIKDDDDGGSERKRFPKEEQVYIGEEAEQTRGRPMATS